MNILFNIGIYIIFAFVLASISSCNRYVVRNSNYPEHEMQARYNLDKGDCYARAANSYREPYPVAQPDLMPRRRTATYSGTSNQGNMYEGYTHGTHRGTITYDDGGSLINFNEWDEYRQYTNVKRNVETARINYVNSCLSILGWQTYKVSQ